MADYEKWIQGIQELEKQNKVEEIKFHEEEKRHDGTKQELQKALALADARNQDLLGIKDNLTKVSAEKSRLENFCSEYAQSNKVLREQTESLKAQLEANSIERRKEKEHCAELINKMNERYRANLEVFRKGGAIVDEESSLEMPPPPPVKIALSTSKENSHPKESAQNVPKGNETEELMSELKALDEYAKQLEGNCKQQNEYIESILAAASAVVCPKCQHNFAVELECVEKMNVV